MEVQEQEQASFIFGYIYRISNNFHCYYGSITKINLSSNGFHDQRKKEFREFLGQRMQR